MKKIIAVLGLASVLFTSCTQSKIGFVNIDDVMDGYEEAKNLEAEFEKEQQELNAVMSQLMMPFQQKVQEFYANVDKMSPAERQKKESELQQEQQKLQAQQQQMQQIVQQTSKQKIEELSGKIDSAVEEYAKKNGFEMIIATTGSTTVMYGSDKLNVSEAVIDYLNANIEEEVEETATEEVVAPAADSTSVATDSIK